ncbi:MAG: aldose epimerase family protein [Gemmobacter sp.]
MSRAIPFAAGRLAGMVVPHGAGLAALALDGAPVILGPPGGGRPAERTWMGAICGRVANRLGHGRARVGGRIVHLAANEGPHMLHGGAQGLSQQDWAVLADGPAAVTLSLVSAAGAMGFPGTLTVTATWALVPPATLRLTLTAASDAETPVNLCQHVYVNLDGAPTIDAHRLIHAARRWLPTDDAGIPTGAVAPVRGTPLDYAAPRPVGSHDATLILADARRDAPAFAARVEAGGRAVELWTTEPALHLYTGEHLPEGLALEGRCGGPRAGLCLEAMGWTDAPNHPHFPSITLAPGAPWRQITEFRFD